MKSLATALVSILMMTSIANAKKSCTDMPKDKWMSEAAFKSKVESLGYKISKFKQPGSCYEIYGTNKEGKKIEAYFNPVDATVVKEELE